MATSLVGHRVESPAGLSSNYLLCNTLDRAHGCSGGGFPISSHGTILTMSHVLTFSTFMPQSLRMDVELVEPLDPEEAKPLIRKIITEGVVSFPTHAKGRLASRAMETSDALNVLRAGVLPVPRKEAPWAGGSDELF